MVAKKRLLCLSALGISAAYLSILFWLGGLLCGGGHGTRMFLYTPFSPFGYFDTGRVACLGFLVIPAIALLLVLQRYHGVCRKAMFALLILHYVGIAAGWSHGLLHNDEWNYVLRTWHAIPDCVAEFVALYLAGQAAIWVLAMKWGRLSPPKANPQTTTAIVGL